MTIPNREEILRIDCDRCRGNGFIRTPEGEAPCPVCGGVGMRERRMPFKPEGYTDEEVAEEFGVESFTRKRDRDDPANL